LEFKVPSKPEVQDWGEKIKRRGVVKNDPTGAMLGMGVSYTSPATAEQLILNDVLFALMP
jgi:hypothetical protein